jgi:hypothetical protein
MIPPHILKELQPWHDKYQQNALEICILVHRKEPIPYDLKLFHYYCIAKCNEIWAKHTKL